MLVALSLYSAYCAIVILILRWQDRTDYSAGSGPLSVNPWRVDWQSPSSLGNFLGACLWLPALIPFIILVHGAAWAYRRIAGNGPPAAERR